MTEQIEKKQWEDVVAQANALSVELKKKPQQYKTGYIALPGGILNAYREGDLNFDEARQAIEKWHDRQIQSLADTPDEGIKLSLSEIHKAMVPDRFNLEKGEAVAKAQLSKAQAIIRAKVEKQINKHVEFLGAYPDNEKIPNEVWQAVEDFRQDTLKLLGGK